MSHNAEKFSNDKVGPAAKISLVVDESAQLTTAATGKDPLAQVTDLFRHLEESGALVAAPKLNELSQIRKITTEIDAAPQRNQDSITGKQSASPREKKSFRGMLASINLPRAAALTVPSPRKMLSAVKTSKFNRAVSTPEMAFSVLFSLLLVVVGALLS